MERPEPLFVPGERVLFVDDGYPELIGMVCTITRVQWCAEEDGWEPPSEWGFECDMALPPILGPDYDMEMSTEDSFRKLPPNEPTTFDASIWQPREITA